MTNNGFLVVLKLSLQQLSSLVKICRYLSYVMDVASPTKDCLDLIYDFLLPIIMKSNHKSVLSHQEVGSLGSSSCLSFFFFQVACLLQPLVPC